MQYDTESHVSRSSDYKTSVTDTMQQMQTKYCTFCYTQRMTFIKMLNLDCQFTPRLSFHGSRNLRNSLMYHSHVTTSHDGCYSKSLLKSRICRHKIQHNERLWIIFAILDLRCQVVSNETHVTDLVFHNCNTDRNHNQSELLTVNTMPEAMYVPD